MSAENKALLRRMYDEVANEGRIELVDELCTEDFVEHEEFPGLSPDRDGVKKFFNLMRDAFQYLRFEVQDIIAEGDKVVGRIVIHGTHEGEFMGVQPSGNRIEVAGVDVVQVRDGRVAAHWGVTDGLAMMQQLGAMSAEPAG